MAVDTGKRRVRPGASKARQEASRELGQQTTTSAHRIPGNDEYSPEVTQKEIVSDRRFEAGQHPAFVRVNVGGTYSLGNYESLRLDVSVTLPCLPSEVDECFTVASDMVAAKLGEEELLWLGAKRSN